MYVVNKHSHSSKKYQLWAHLRNSLEINCSGVYAGIDGGDVYTFLSFPSIHLPFPLPTFPFPPFPLEVGPP